MEHLVMDAAPAQLEQIERLEQRCFSSPWTHRQLAGQLTDDRHVCLCARAGETVLGYVGLMYVLDEGYISNVAVAPEARRQGVAASLIAALTARARALGLSFLTLEARASNEPAIRLYEKMGFQRVGRRRNYYEKPVEDAVLMTLWLKGEQTI